MLVLLVIFFTIILYARINIFNSKIIVYLIECRVCGEQDTSSTVNKFLMKAKQL